MYIKLLNVVRVWRFKMYYGRGYFGLYWLSDFGYCSNLVRYEYSTEKPIIEIGR